MQSLTDEQYQAHVAAFEAAGPGKRVAVVHGRTVTSQEELDWAIKAGEAEQHSLDRQRGGVDTPEMTYAKLSGLQKLMLTSADNAGLQSQNATLQSRVDDLESQLRQKDQTESDLRAQIDTLSEQVGQLTSEGTPATPAPASPDSASADAAKPRSAVRGSKPTPEPTPETGITSNAPAPTPETGTPPPVTENAP